MPKPCPSMPAHPWNRPCTAEKITNFVYRLAEDNGAQSIGRSVVHAIGRMKKRGKGPQVELDRGGKRTALDAGGWEHFR